MSFPDTATLLTSTMNPLRFALVALVCTAASAFAQTATLTADTPALSSTGGTVSFTATVTYANEPGALGWAIALPADWSFVSVSGPNVPTIAPDSGSTGTLEFAFATVPAQRAEFTVVVQYPPNTGTTTATSTALIRAGGKLTTLTPKPLRLTGVSTPQEDSRR